MESLPAPKTYSSLAIVGFMLAVVAFMGLFVFASLPAVVCGHKALRQIKQDPLSKGEGIAWAGLILGYANMVGCAAFFVLSKGSATSPFFFLLF